MTARTRSRVLADFERYAFGVLRGTRVTTDDGALANRVLGPGMQEVSERAAPLRATPEARVLRCFVDAHADQMDRCVRESAPLGPARGRVAVWVRHRAPAAPTAIAADAQPDVSAAVALASAS